MDQQYYGVIEMVFSFGVILAVGVQQLWSLSRERKRDEAKQAEKDRAERNGDDNTSPDWPGPSS